MTLIEVLVAALVLTVGLLAVYKGLNAAQDGSTSAERSAAMAQAGEQALQAIEALPYAQVANTVAPAPQTPRTDSTIPTYYVTTGGSCASTCFQPDPTNASYTEQFDVDATNGVVSPSPTTGVVPAPNKAGCTSTTTANCRFTYAIYRYITDVKDSVCSQTGVTCTGPSYKRITVAVKNTSGGPPYASVNLSTFVGVKSAGNANNPLTSSTIQCLDGAATVPCTH